MVEPSPRLFRKLHRALTYKQLFSELEFLCQRHLPARNIVIFAEVLQNVIPQVILSSDQIYEKLAGDQMRAMILESPLYHYLHGNPAMKVIHWRDYYSGESSLMADPHYQKYLRPFGWMYFATLAFAVKDGPNYATIIFSRSREQGDFTNSEKEFLQHLHLELKEALWRCQRIWQKDKHLSALVRWIDPLDSAVILLDWELNLLSTTRSGRLACLEWMHGPEVASSLFKKSNVVLPEDLMLELRRAKELCFRQILQYQKPSGDWTRELFCSSDENLKAWISVLPFSRSGLGFPFWRVEFFRSTQPSQHQPATHKGELLTLLSAREMVVIQELMKGKTNTDIAQTLNRSLGTVKNQISSAFVKLGVRTRQELLVRYAFSADETQKNPR